MVNEKEVVVLVELFFGDQSKLLSDFMKVQRWRDEKLLQFFTKLRQMFSYATLKKVMDLKNDAVALQLLVHKLKDNMETIFSTEFTKRMETQLIAGQLTMAAVSNALIKISRQTTRAGRSANILDV